MIRYVVTGCAGSATGWAHRLMTALGSPCSHQGYYTTSGVKSRLRRRVQGDSSWCAVPHLRGDLAVVLLVRDPLGVVRSIDQLLPFLTDACDDPASRYVHEHQPQVWAAQDRLGRILRYVATWDATVDSQPRVLPLTVDDAGAAQVAEAFTHLTARPVSRVRARRVMSRLGRGFNSHGGSQSTITWQTILDHPDGPAVADKAGRWGYR